LDNKTKSNIKATLEAMVMDFQKGDLARVFCTNTDIVPELSHYGAVIVLDFPIKVWQRGGLLAQHIFKFAWQKAIERRPIHEKTRPCFLWADEYQLFASSYDAEFQSTARSSKACSVFMTQSIPALRLLNNFQTTIIHTCKDPTTQVWAAELIGKGLQWRHNESYSRQEGTNFGKSSGSGSGQSFGSSASIGDGISDSANSGRHYVQPSFFGTSLRMGGARNQFLVDGVVIQGGRTWQHNNQPAIKVPKPSQIAKAAKMGKEQVVEIAAKVSGRFEREQGLISQLPPHLQALINKDR
jgi:hypothetical protein